MAFHLPSFFPSFKRAPHHNTTENLLRAVVLHLHSVVGLLTPLAPILVTRQISPKHGGGSRTEPPFGIKQADIVKQ